MKDQEKYELFSNYIKDAGIIEQNNNDDAEHTTHYDQQNINQRRELAEIIELGNGDCNVTTVFNSSESFESQRNANNTFYGVMFRLTARDNLDILTIEFDTAVGRQQDEYGNNNDTEIPRVEVFTRLGGFRSYYDSPEGWTLIANTTAVPTASSRGNIIPVHQFQRITMRQREERSFYINTPAQAVIYSGTSEGNRFGHNYAQNEHLRNIVGYALDGPSFNGTGVQNNRQFHGFIHYRATVPCQEADDNLAVEFTWFVNEYDAPGVLIDLANEYVIAALLKALRDDATFIQYQNFYGLVFMGATSMGFEHEAQCPFSWDGCARVVTTALFQHLPTVNVPKLHIDVLHLWANVDTSGEGVFQMGYYGPIGIIVDYWIRLHGVPENIEMDDVMITYFQDTTTQFLTEATQGAVTGVQVQEQSMAGMPSTRYRYLRQDYENEEEELLYYHEEERRNLQDTTLDERNVNGTQNDDANNNNNLTDTTTEPPPPPPPPSNLLQDLQSNVVTSSSPAAGVRVTIYGMYKTSTPPANPNSHRDVDMTQVRNILESAFSRDEDIYIRALRRGIYEPGQISEPERIRYFADIDGVSVNVVQDSIVLPPTRAPTLPPVQSNTPAPTLEPLPERQVHGLSYNVVYYMSIFFIIIGALLCCCFMCVHAKNYMDERSRLGVLERRAQQKVDKLEREKARRDKKRYG